jgi:hypothetical protein
MPSCKSVIISVLATTLAEEGVMRLQKREREFLTTLMAVADKLLDLDNGTQSKSNGTRKRRTGRDLAQLKKGVIAARKRKVPVQQIADNFRITPSYVYQIIR